MGSLEGLARIEFARLKQTILDGNDPTEAYYELEKMILLNAQLEAEKAINERAEVKRKANEEQRRREMAARRKFIDAITGHSIIGVMLAGHIDGYALDDSSCQPLYELKLDNGTTIELWETYAFRPWSGIWARLQFAEGDEDKCDA